MAAAILVVARGRGRGSDPALGGGGDAGPRARRRGRRPSVGLVVDARPRIAAPRPSSREYLPRVEAVAAPALARTSRRPAVAAQVAALRGDRRRDPRPAGRHQPTAATSPGLLVGLLGWACSRTPTGGDLDGRRGPRERSRASWAARRSRGSAFTGGSGLITVRPGAWTAERGPARRARSGQRDPWHLPSPPPSVLERVEEAGAEVSLEEARVVVVGGRGVGGPEGFGLVDELAGLLGGVVGRDPRIGRCRLDPVRPADRPDGQDREAGPVPRARRVGRDAAPGGDAGLRGRSWRSTAIRTRPIAEIADLFVVGDLFEVAPALAAELRARRGG